MILPTKSYSTRSDYEIVRDSRDLWRASTLFLAVVIIILVSLWPV